MARPSKEASTVSRIFLGREGGVPVWAVLMRVDLSLWFRYGYPAHYKRAQIAAARRYPTVNQEMFIVSN
jgi:hypothetical protein